MANIRKLSPAREKTLRDWADLLKLHAVCDNKTCCRAGRCRGAIKTCAPKNFARLPQGVQGLACCLWDARAKGLSFDAAMADFAGSPAEAAWQAWSAADGGRAAGGEGVGSRAPSWRGPSAVLK